MAFRRYFSERNLNEDEEKRLQKKYKVNIQNLLNAFTKRKKPNLKHPDTEEEMEEKIDEKIDADIIKIFTKTPLPAYVKTKDLSNLIEYMLLENSQKRGGEKIIKLINSAFFDRLFMLDFTGSNSKKLSAEEIVKEIFKYPRAESCIIQLKKEIYKYLFTAKAQSKFMKSFSSPVVKLSKNEVNLDQSSQEKITSINNLLVTAQAEMKKFYERRQYVLLEKREGFKSLSSLQWDDLSFTDLLDIHKTIFDIDISASKKVELENLREKFPLINFLSHPSFHRISPLFQGELPRFVTRESLMSLFSAGSDEGVLIFRDIIISPPHGDKILARFLFDQDVDGEKNFQAADEFFKRYLFPWVESIEYGPFINKKYLRREICFPVKYEENKAEIKEDITERVNDVNSVDKDKINKTQLDMAKELKLYMVLFYLESLNKAILELQVRLTDADGTKTEMEIIQNLENTYQDSFLEYSLTDFFNFILKFPDRGKNILLNQYFLEKFNEENSWDVYARLAWSALCKKILMSLNSPDQSNAKVEEKSVAKEIFVSQGGAASLKEEISKEREVVDEKFVNLYKVIKESERLKQVKEKYREEIFSPDFLVRLSIFEKDYAAYLFQEKPNILRDIYKDEKNWKLLCKELLIKHSSSVTQYDSLLKFSEFVFNNSIFGRKLHDTLIFSDFIFKFTIDYPSLATIYLNQFPEIILRFSDDQLNELSAQAWWQDLCVDLLSGSDLSGMPKLDDKFKKLYAIYTSNEGFKYEFMRQIYSEDFLLRIMEQKPELAANYIAKIPVSVLKNLATMNFNEDVIDKWKKIFEKILISKYAPIYINNSSQVEAYHQILSMLSGDDDIREKTSGLYSEMVFKLLNKPNADDDSISKIGRILEEDTNTLQKLKLNWQDPNWVMLCHNAEAEKQKREVENINGKIKVNDNENEGEYYTNFLSRVENNPFLRDKYQAALLLDVKDLHNHQLSSLQNRRSETLIPEPTKLMSLQISIDSRESSEIGSSYLSSASTESPSISSGKLADNNFFSTCFSSSRSRSNAISIQKKKIHEDDLDKGSNNTIVDNKLKFNSSDGDNQTHNNNEALSFPIISTTTSHPVSPKKLNPDEISEPEDKYPDNSSSNRLKNS